MLKLLAALTGIIGVSIAAFALHPATADAAAGGSGKNVYTIKADCGDGQIDVRVNLAAGEFSAAHAVDNGTFVPIAFGPQTGSFTSPDGNVFPIDEAGGSKGGSAHSSGDAVTCSFDIDVVFPDGSKLKLEGTVTGFYPGAH